MGNSYVTNFCPYIFCLFVIVSCIGCDEISEDEVYFPGAGIENVCISEDRPAEVLIIVSGLGGTGCGYTPFKNVYADRVGNTISLKPTVIKSNNGGLGYTTCSGIIEYYGEATITGLDVGEYELTSNDRERLRLRIEKKTASVLLRLYVTNITVEMKTSEGSKRFDAFPVPGIAVPDPLIETDEPVQVTIGVKGYFLFGSHIEDPSEITSIKREAEDITVDISGEVPITNCMQDINLIGGPQYDTEIDLGIFAAGDYRVNVDRNEVRFSIRPDVR